MSRYRIIERVGEHYERVETYADLERHHPSSGRQPGRTYATLDGELEEVRHLQDGRLLVKKDLILLRDPAGPVYVPAPASGYVHHLNDPSNAIRIYDTANGQQSARLLAQSLHMQWGSSPPDGSWIDYGMPLGRMGDVGSPGSVHVHLEAEPSQFRRYVEDINAGNITPERYPVPPSTVVAPAGDTLTMRDVQQALNQLGYRDPDGRALAVDGIAGARSRHAITAFQHDFRLAADGVAGPLTAGALAVAMVELPLRSGSDKAWVLREGSTGADVRAAQSALGRLGYEPEPGRQLAVDGIFGSATARSVHAFQLTHGLSPDHIVGNQTRAALAAALKDPMISERTHPRYDLFQQATAALRRWDSGNGEQAVEPGQHRNMAANLALAAHQGGLGRIDTVFPSTGGNRLFAVQGGPLDPAQRHVYVDLGLAVQPTNASVHSPIAVHGVRDPEPRLDHPARARAFAP